MKRIVVSVLIVCLIGGIIGVVIASSNRLFKKSGTFEDFPNMDGNWERAADIHGPLIVDASRKVYIDLNTVEDVFKCDCSFMSYAEDPMFTGTYWLSASIWLPDVGTNEHGGTFSGPWWDYEANSHKSPQAGNNPQDISLTSAYSWANGAGPVPEDPAPMESGSDPQPQPPPEIEHYSVYAQVPF